MQRQSLKEYLTAGMRRSYKNSRNVPGLLMLKNGVARPDGIYPYEQVQIPASVYDVTSSPLLVPTTLYFKGPTYIVAFTGDNKVYLLTEDAYPWTPTEITTFLDPYDPRAEPTITGSNEWSFCGFQRGWIACNGTVCAFSIDGEGVYIDSVSNCLCVGSFRGQVFWGGMSKFWARFIAGSIDNHIYSGLGVTFGDSNVDDNWVRWCSISGKDIFMHVWPERFFDVGSSRLGDSLLVNGEFESGSSQWTNTTGFTIGTGVPATASAATVNLTYTLTAAEQSEDGYYLLEVDIDITSGTVSIDTNPDYTNVFGAKSTGAALVDGVNKFYIYNETADYPTAIRLLTSTFTGTLYGIKLIPVSKWDSRAEWRDMVEENQSGYTPGYDAGDFLAWKPLYDHMIGYWANCIIAFTPTGVPIATFAKTKVCDFGIAGRLCVTGDERKHVFMDTTGKIWSLGNDLNLKEEGGYEYFSPYMTDNHSAAVSMSYDSSSGEAYITLDEGTEDFATYILTASGFSKILRESVMSLLNVRAVDEGENWLVGHVEAGSDAEFQLITDYIDFGTQDLKTISRVTVVCDNGDTVKGKFWYKEKSSSAVRATETKNLDSRGELNLPLTCGAFSLELTCATYSAIRIYDIIVEFELGGTQSLKQLFSRR